MIDKPVEHGLEFCKEKIIEWRNEGTHEQGHVHVIHKE
jgi:hypothetical protein